MPMTLFLNVRKMINEIEWHVHLVSYLIHMVSAAILIDCDFHFLDLTSEDLDEVLPARTENLWRYD